MRATFFTNHSIRTALPALGLALLLVGCSNDSKETDVAAPTPAPATEVSALPQLADLPSTEPQQTVDPSAAAVTVNGKSLTEGELAKNVERIMQSPQAQRIPAQARGQARASMRQRLVEQYVMRQVLTSEAAKQEIEISDEERNTFVEEIKGSLPPGMTLEDAAKQAGGSMDDLLKEVTDELRVRKLLEANAPVTDEQVAAYYEENKDTFATPETVRARHILLPVEAEATDEQRAAQKAIAEDCRKQLLEGGDFAALAVEHSSCPSKQRGGDLGTFGRGQMVPPFEAAAFGAKIGEIGEVVETRFGYHVIEVTEKNEAGAMTLEDAKPQIERQLRDGAVQAYIGTLRENASISYADGAPAAL